MKFTIRVAATAALLASLSANVLAALLPDAPSVNEEQTLVVESSSNPQRLATSALRMSAFDDGQGRNALIVTSGALLSSAASQNVSAPANWISSEIAVPASMTPMGHASATVTMPAGLTLIQPKVRTLPLYMQRASNSQR